MLYVLMTIFRGHQAGLESPKNKPSQAGLAWLVLQKRGSWLGLAWLVNSKRGHRLGFDLAKNSPAWVGFDMILDHFNI